MSLSSSIFRARRRMAPMPPALSPPEGGFPKRVTPRSSHSALRIQVATPAA